MSPREESPGVFHPDFGALMNAWAAWVFMYQDGCEGENLIRVLRMSTIRIQLAVRHSRR